LISKIFRDCRLHRMSYFSLWPRAKAICALSCKSRRVQKMRRDFFKIFALTLFPLSLPRPVLLHPQRKKLAACIANSPTYSDASPILPREFQHPDVLIDPGHFATLRTHEMPARTSDPTDLWRSGQLEMGGLTLAPTAQLQQSQGTHARNPHRNGLWRWPHS
jgi:hypothetical protein